MQQFLMEFDQMDKMIFQPYQIQNQKILAPELILFSEFKNSKLYSFFNDYWRERLQLDKTKYILSQLKFYKLSLNILVAESNEQVERIFRIKVKDMQKKSRSTQCNEKDKSKEYIDYFEQFFFWMTYNFLKLVKTKETFDQIMELQSEHICLLETIQKISKQQLNTIEKLASQKIDEDHEIFENQTLLLRK